MANFSHLPLFFKSYIREINSFDLISTDEEKRLASLIRNGSEVQRRIAITSLVNANLRLVVKIASDFTGWGVAKEDLISEGNIGLVRAAEKFDPDKGAKFSSYAAWWIKQAMRRSIAKNSRIVRLPIQTGQKLVKIRSAAAVLKAELDRTPTAEEIAQAVGLSAESVAKLLLHADYHIAYLDAYIKDDSDSTFADIISDENAISPDKQLGNEDEMIRINTAMKTLSPREKTVISLRFFQNRTLDEISHLIGKTRERVRQIQNEALAKLKLAL